MVEAKKCKLSQISDVGVPKLLKIWVNWSSSDLPENKTLDVIISDKIQPKAHKSTEEV